MSFKRVCHREKVKNYDQLPIFVSVLVQIAHILNDEFMATIAAEATPSDTCGIIVPLAFVRITPSISAHQTVFVVAVAIAVLAAVLFSVTCGVAAVARAALFAIDLHSTLVSVAVPHRAKPKLHELALMAERENLQLNL